MQNKKKKQLLQKLSKISDCSSLLVFISIKRSDSVAVARNSERKKKRGYLLSHFYKNVVFPALAEYSYFSAENVLVLFLNYSLRHFRLRIYCGINYS